MFTGGLLITTLLTQILIAGGITLMIVSTYAILRLALLVRDEGTDGVAKWACEIQSHFTIGRPANLRNDEAVDGVHLLGNDASLSSDKTEGSLVVIEDLKETASEEPAQGQPT